MRKYGEQIEYLVRVVTAIIWEKMIEITTAFLTETMEIRRHGTTPYKH